MATDCNMIKKRVRGDLYISREKKILKEKLLKEKEIKVN